MNLKKLLAGVLTVGAAVGVAVAHNIDAIIANPSLIVSIIFTAAAAAILGHDHATITTTAKLTNTPPVAPK